MLSVVIRGGTPLYQANRDVYNAALEGASVTARQLFYFIGVKATSSSTSLGDFKPCGDDFTLAKFSRLLKFTCFGHTYLYNGYL